MFPVQNHGCLFEEEQEMQRLKGLNLENEVPRRLFLSTTVSCLFSVAKQETCICDALKKALTMKCFVSRLYFHACNVRMTTHGRNICWFPCEKWQWNVTNWKLLTCNLFGKNKREVLMYCWTALIPQNGYTVLTPRKTGLLPGVVLSSFFKFSSNPFWILIIPWIPKL